ncbi:MAG: hypothetical protein LIP02_03430, partial [Bacteroidales bacterium]|nr:hypothetical protein [Bacteroidales bacterium]
ADYNFKSADFSKSAENRKEGAPYTWNSATKTVSVSYTDAKLNDEDRDAFYSKETFTVNGSATITSTLKRPFAQINVGTSDIGVNAMAGKTISTAMSVSNVYSSFNLSTGAVAGSSSTVSFVETKRPNQGKTTQDADYEAFPVGATGAYEYLAMAYVLVPSDKITSDIHLDFYDGGAQPFHDLDVNGAPLQRNYRTNIFGALLTSNVDFTITINPAYDGYYTNGATPWDGTSVSEPTVDTTNNIVYISSAEELAYVAQQVNSGTENYHGYTLVQTANIDLNNQVWAPIGVSVNENPFSGDYDGKGYTIYNLNVEKREYAGLFGYVGYKYGQQQGAPKIMNITVENAVVKGAHFVGVVAGNANLQFEGVLSGCTVRNAVVEGYVDGDEDGNKIGGVVGHVVATYSTVTGNKIYDSQITAIRDCGSISGNLYIWSYNMHELSNNYAENVDIYVTPNTANANFGEIIGRRTLGTGLGIDKEYGNSFKNVNIYYQATTSEELANQIANAADGALIKLTAGTFTIPTTVSNKSLTIEGVGEATVIDMSAGGTPAEGAANAYYWAGSDVTISNATVKFSDASTVNYCGFLNINNLTYDKCTIEGKHHLYGTSATYNNCVINGTAKNYVITTWGVSKLTLNNCQFNTEYDRCILVYNESGKSIDIEATNCTFTCENTGHAKGALEAHCEYACNGTMTFNGCTTNYPEGLWVVKYNDYFTVTVDGVEVATSTKN